MKKLTHFCYIYIYIYMHYKDKNNKTMNKKTIF